MTASIGSIKQRDGFTIVELLIVIVVVAILAAITVVAYNGIQARANLASVQSDLTSLARKYELFFVDNGRYPNSVPDLLALKATVSRPAYLTDSTLASNLIPCVTSDSQNYAIGAVAPNGSRLYIARGKPVAEYTGATSWLGAANWSAVCSSALSGSATFGLGAGWATADGWRAWTGS